ncbi:MAG TPA: DEAD/DEAH box helicase, partial [Chloroflexota bacterium]|nr:DEAD/DEAH box helicase [Chloroflexota bacterium]
MSQSIRNDDGPLVDDASNKSGRLGPAEHAKQYPFPLDQFQLDAMVAWDDGDTVIVSAPTGTGKTVVAEYAIARAIYAGKRLFVTTPIKALSMQKLRDLRAEYGDENVGVMTGDITDHPAAPILVMTTEILRNRLAIEGASTVHGTDGVVFDEFHFIADPDRGRVWEETVLLLPPDVPLLCLSATIPNADDLAGWLIAEGRSTRIVRHDVRAVPLDLWYAYDEKFVLLIDAHGRQRPVPDLGGERAEARRRQAQQRRRAWLVNSGWSSTSQNDDEPAEFHRRPTGKELIERLDERMMLPAIIFAFSRQRVQKAAEECIPGVSASRIAAHEREIAVAIEACLENLSPEERQLSQVAQLRHCLMSGVGFHHAGLIPALKELVERLFAAGRLAVVCATDTLALGVNLPARTVVIEKVTRYTLDGHRPLTGREFQQLSGRAGRRGMDEAGHGVLIYDEWLPAADAVAIAKLYPEPVTSAFTLDYASYLALLHDRDRDQVRQLIRRSFRYYRPEGAPRRRDALLEGVISRQEAGLYEVLIEHHAIHETSNTVTIFGRQLARAHHAAALPLLSLFQQPLGSRLESFELAELAIWFSSDRTPRDARPVSPARLSRPLARILPHLVTQIAHLNATERRCQLPMTPVPVPELIGLGWRWMRGERLGRLAALYELDEGDVLQAMGDAIGLLRLLSEGVDDPDLRGRMILGARTLWRDTLLGR